MPPKQKKHTKGDAVWLLILESPSKCSKIESFLGSQYKCIASNGHIRTIDGLKAIDMTGKTLPKFSIIPTKQDHVNQMRLIINEFPNTNIILATDDDREGESIAWHICETFGLPVETTHRIVFHEITQSALEKAIQNKRTINIDLVHAQFARQALDIIVGFRISPILWKYLYNNKENGLSAGRCQTPALRLVYENEIEKKNKTNVKMSHIVYARFFPKNIEFQLSREHDNNTIYDFLLKSVVFQHTLYIGSPYAVIKGPPVPFNTSRLLQTASSQLRLSPKDTMALSQVLYQDGYITYMRTENTKYSTDFLNEIGSHIRNLYGEKYVGKMTELKNNNGINPHEAIRITHIETRELPKTYDGKLTSLYKLIWTNTMESCMSDAHYKVVECRISAPDELHYLHTIEIPVFSGWKQVSHKQNIDEANGLLFYIQSVKNSGIKYNKIETRVSFHNIHSHYSESSLIKKLEDLGIGRPSTFASIVDTIQERGYVKKQEILGVKFSCNEYKLENGTIETRVIEKTVGNEKDKLVIEPIGITIIEFLIEHFGLLFSYEYTSEMETRLDKVSHTEWNHIYNECDKTIQTMIKPIKKASYKIDETHDIIFTRNGPVIRDNVSTELKSITKDIHLDIERLKTSKYTVEELTEQKSRVIGEWEGNELQIHNGRYGIYAQWGDNKKSLSYIKKPLTELTLEDITQCLSKPEKAETSSILRILNNEFSVRKGKYGPYVYYKRDDMNKPVFYNIKNFKESFTYCKPEILIQWICDTYNISR